VWLSASKLDPKWEGGWKVTNVTTPAVTVVISETRWFILIGFNIEYS